MRGKLVPFAGIAALTVALDQAAKAWVQHAFRLYESRPVIDGFFHLTYVRNPGAAFGILSSQGSGFRQPFFLAVTLVALAVIGVILVRLPRDRRWPLVGLGLVSGGAVGNLIDRLRWGEVVDFLDVFWRQYHWPAFNLADSAITLGVAILVLEELFGRGTHKPTAPRGQRTVSEKGR